MDKQREQEALVRLVGLFCPILMDVVVTWKLRPKATEGELKKMTEELRAEWPDPPNIKVVNFPNDELETEVLCFRAATHIVIGWMRFLIDNFSSIRIDKDFLDDSMLPIGTSPDLVRELPEDDITNDHAREVLKRIRASLPEGEFLPEDAKAILQGRGIQIA